MPRTQSEARFTVSVLVEIPKGSRNKYEWDKKRNAPRFDRMLYSAVHYPSDYGFTEDTLALDVYGWEGRDAALKSIRESQLRYKEAPAH